MTVRILCIAGARPNFMKVAPLMRALSRTEGFEPRLVHTGQHYDDALSRVFFDELRLPRPDVELAVGSGSHAEQTAEIIRRFETVLQREQPHAVLVVGDVNSTIGCALAASKFQLDPRRHFQWRFGRRTRPVTIHVEAGLRSFDEDMPEEINRRLTDAISDLLFVSEPAGVENLRREGVPAERVFFVGNVMIDTLVAAREQAMASTVLERLGLEERRYGVLTLHRPGNVDDPRRFRALLSVLDELAGRARLVFPVHPRTAARLATMGIRLDPARWSVTGPLGYLDSLKLQAVARLVVTDSGGVQEETTILGVPCVTLRDNTERPVTVTDGTNVLAGTTRDGVRRAIAAALDAVPAARVPKHWDGQAAGRIASVLAEAFSGRAEHRRTARAGLRRAPAVPAAAGRGLAAATGG
jgi:UDP-N-acetylglucosamine 2-epimerase (non-hydrolysing)